VHKGDNLTGAGSGDDETIVLNISKVSQDVVYLIPVISVFTVNKQFDDVSGAYCRVIEP
jgi:tellurium resistance protein TerZ